MVKPPEGHHGHHRKPPLCQEDSPERPMYQNIKPKVGHLYQSKLPKLGAELSSRTPPSRISTAYPHLTESEAQNMNNIDTESLPSVETTNVVPPAPGYGPMEVTMPSTSRGGLLIHRPSKQTDEFLSALHPLPPVASQQWIQEMIGRSGNNTGRGGRRKRKFAIETSTINNTVKRKRPPMEEDEYFLEYLTLRHNGNIDTAKLAFLVASGAGRAYRARRSMHKENHEGRFRRSPLTSSQSWYERLDQECPFEGEFEQDLPVQEDMKHVWKAVLASAQELGHSVEEDKKPLLSHVINFIRNAYCLPPPEESFGSRAVVVEGISDSMHFLLDHVTKAHDAQAKILDMLYDESNEGIDMEAVKKFTEELASSLTLRLDIMDVLDKQLDIATKWQVRLKKLSREVLVPDDIDDLAQLEELLREASQLSIRWRGQVEHEEHVEKAYQLRDRLREWQQDCENGKKENFKFVSGLVRDAYRLNINFPEVTELLRFHQDAESWVERASVAVRSRVPLTEIESLIDRAEQMPLNLDEWTNKLQNRISQAQSWISEFQDFVPAPFPDGKVDNLAWMSRMRKALQTDDKLVLHQIQDIANEGTRIPVDIDCVKLLLVEIDAKDWSAKAIKWIPNDSMSDDEGGSSAGKRAKLVDIRDHLEKAEALREKLVLSPAEKQAWVLEGEEELQSIIEAADIWYDKYHEYLEFDNRKSQGNRQCLSIATLRQIVNEGNLIHANIGIASGKLSRMLGQAETWYGEYGDLLRRCGIPTSITPASTEESTDLATLEEINAATQSAEANVSLDLDEARSLRELKERIEKWQERVLEAAPKRSKRPGKGKHQDSRYTVDDLKFLIEESSSLPIKTDDDTERLRHQVENVHRWRAQARQELDNIATSLRSLRQSVNSDFGPPGEYYDDDSRDDGVASGKKAVSDDSQPAAEVAVESLVSKADVSPTAPETKESQSDFVTNRCHMTSLTSGNISISSISLADCTVEQKTEDSSQADSSTAESEIDARKGSVSTVSKMISSLLESSKLTSARTSEEEMAELLDRAAKWIIRSLECIDSPKEVYDKKTFELFDEFIVAGEEIIVCRDSLQGQMLDDGELLNRVGLSLRDLVSDQLVRLKILQSHRDKFITWFRNAQEMLSSKEKRVTFDVINQLAEQSHDYPASSDMVQKVRHVAQRAAKWKEAAGSVFGSKEKPTMQEAKELLEAGDKLNLMCDELKVLRNAVRTARAWANRVKRTKIEQEAVNSSNVTKLIKEYESLYISMPNEFSKLSSALKGYCICRQPYGGFMIGCDDCGEWYHGPCVGVSEARADKCDKFLCVRCSLKRTFTSSASAIASVIKKWTDPSELRKVRQYEAQKHGRKVRKEKRDIENLALETESLAAVLSTLDCEGSQEVDPQGAELTASNSEGVAVSPSSPDPESKSNEAANLQPTAVANPDSDQKQFDLAQLPTTERSSTPPQANGNNVANTESSTPQLMENPITKRKNEIEAELNKAARSVKASGDRLAALNAISNERKQQEDREDEKKTELLKWCIRVRSLVLVPSIMQRADASLPSSDGALSPPMVEVLNDATVLGIRDLPVVAEVENAFKCIAWCCYAMPLLARRPTLKEITSIISKGAALRLPEERPMRMMKSMASRAKNWQNKVVKALAFKPNVADPVNLDTLQGLAEAATDIPLTIPGENCVQNVLDDKGTRYCLCGGPHFGSFMLGCDRCERWYHGRCVQVKSKDGDSLKNWLCPPCRGVPDVGTHCFSILDFDYTDDEADEEDMNDSDEDIATSAPDPAKLWPPFGLLNSKEAIEALGEVCCAIRDDTAGLPEPDFSQYPSVMPAPTQAFGTLFAANGVNLTKAFANPYSFGAGFSNGGNAPAAPLATPPSLFANVTSPTSAAAPLFANSLFNHTLSRLSVSTALTNGNGSVGHIDTKEEAKSRINEKTESARAHGFHGFGSTQDVTAGTSHFYGTATHVRESAISSSNKSTGNLTVAGPLPDSQGANVDKTESKQPPPPIPMEWQPAIIHISSGNSSGATTREETTTQNDSPLPQTDNLASANSSEPMEVDEGTSTREASLGIAPKRFEVTTEEKPTRTEKTSEDKPSLPDVATNAVSTPSDVAKEGVPTWPKMETTHTPTRSPSKVAVANTKEKLVEIPVQDRHQSYFD